MHSENATHEIEQIFLQDEKSVLLIDGPSLQGMTKTISKRVDYKALLNFFRANTSLLRAFYYTSIKEDSQDGLAHVPMRKLIDFLSFNGYIVKVKTSREFDGDNGGPSRIVHGRHDVEMSVDAMELAGKADHFVLVSGKGDFAYLAQALQRAGAKVTVLTPGRGQNQTESIGMSDDLRRQVDQTVSMYDIPDCFLEDHA